MKNDPLKNEAWTLIRESDSKLAAELVVTDDAINFVTRAWISSTAEPR